MLQAFVFESVAVLVCPWQEPADPPERGTRVELRLLAPEPRRGSFSAAQRVVIDQPVFRADLFDVMDAPPGNLLRRALSPELRRCRAQRPVLARRGQVRSGRLARTRARRPRPFARPRGVATVDAAALARDADALRHTIPAIITSVTSTWDAVHAGEV